MSQNDVLKNELQLLQNKFKLIVDDCGSLLDIFKLSNRIDEIIKEHLNKEKEILH
ncbi:MAG: hypothetical protein PWQ37_966 [Candidatus Petromonas sp.]|jgi:hypothetical protein|nr:hypothetical protein [Candidatus Petromonas sp.]